MQTRERSCAGIRVDNLLQADVDNAGSQDSVTKQRICISGAHVLCANGNN